MEATSSEKRKIRKSPGTDKKIIMSEILRLRDAVKEGRLSERVDINLVSGESRILLWRVNDMLDAIIEPLRETSERLAELSKGNIPLPLTTELRGELEALRKNLNAVTVEISQYKANESQHDQGPTAAEANGEKPKRDGNFPLRLMKIFGVFLAAVAVILLLGGSAYPQSLPRVSGSVFGDYYYNVDNHLPANMDMQAFDYRRIYVGAEDSLASRVSGRFLVESNPVFTSAGTADLGLDVKAASLTFDSMLFGSDVTFGIQPTPIIAAADAIFGYRSLENSMEDLHSISYVTNMGLSVHSAFSKTTSAIFMLGNNINNGLWMNRYKIAYVQFIFRPSRNLVAVVSGDYAGASSEKYLRTGDGILNYRTAWFSFGGEAYMQDVEHNAYAGTALGGGTSQTYGLGADGWISIINDLRFVARCDYWNPNNAFSDASTNPLDNSWAMLLAGLDYKYSRDIHFIPNLVYVTYGLPGSRPDITARATIYLNYQ